MKPQLEVQPGKDCYCEDIILPEKGYFTLNGWFLYKKGFNFMLLFRHIFGDFLSLMDKGIKKETFIKLPPKFIQKSGFFMYEAWVEVANLDLREKKNNIKIVRNEEYYSIVYNPTKEGPLEILEKIIKLARKLARNREEIGLFEKIINREYALWHAHCPVCAPRIGQRYVILIKKSTDKK